MKHGQRIGPFYLDVDRGVFRFMVGRWGLSFVDHREYPPLFSERYGYTKAHHVGHWCIKRMRRYADVKEAA